MLSLDFITIFFISLGLAMDAFAVSVTNGMCMVNMNKKNAFLQSFSFGIFQGIMPLIGFLSGIAFTSYVQNIDHWIALVLLSFIGIKMIIEAIKEIKNPDSCNCINNRITRKMILLQSVATSIDALAVGITFAVVFDNVFSVIYSSLTIALITFLFCMFGVLAGKKFGNLLKEKAQIFGGVVLVLIGLKIFIEDMLQIYLNQ